MFFARALAVVAMTTVSLAAQVYQIDPETVDPATRASWCVSQEAACPLLCLQNPKVQDASTASNECDPANLQYSCICSNGIQPDIGNFSQTIPFFLCQEFGNQCVNACGTGNTPCQSACRTDNPCGAQNPTRVNITTSSSVVATATDGSTATAGPAIYTGLGESSSSSSKSSDKDSGSNAVLAMGHSYGLAVVLAGLFTGFAMVL